MTVETVNPSSPLPQDEIGIIRGRILSVVRCVHQSHWDSGQPDTPYWNVTYWNTSSDQPTSVTVWCAYDNWNYAGEPEVDATEEYTDLSRRYNEVRAWFIAQRDKCTRAVLSANDPVVGDRVEVYKGRKAPKGEYEIAVIGESQFGPYYHLRDRAGTWHKFISRDNCRLVKSAKLVDSVEAEYKEAFLTAASYQPAFSTRNGKYEARVEIKPDAPALRVLADKLEDDGETDKPRFLRAMIAASEAGLPW